MEIRQGTSVFSGYAMGSLFVYRKREVKVECKAVMDAEAEVARYMEAKEKTLAQLVALEEKTKRDVGAEQAEIFESHQMMLEDPDFVEGITDMIRQSLVNSEYAISMVSVQFAEMFRSIDDAYLQERARDVEDISGRLIQVLDSGGASLDQITEPVILVAEDLTPSETVQFDKEKILAFVTQKGSANSHTAILARMMNIPCIIDADIELDPELTGKYGIVDGFAGKVYIEPTDEVEAEMQEKKRQEEARQAELRKMIGLPTVTKSGRQIHLYSNIGGPGDVDTVLKNDSEGIGLFRSEFLYIGREDYPTEEEQFTVYKRVLSRMDGKKVIIRTLDIGADKQADYFEIPHEENPAMGFRAIRICLERTDVFKTQLRAIYRASAYGTAAIMFPMIISVEEVRRVKEIVAEVQEELRQQDIPYGHVELGIMVETPASVVIADLLAEEVDFFSIGTNDLTQYTLAVDRQNQSLKNTYDPHHTAILRMIEHTCKCAHEHGAWCGICGELGADMSLTEQFVEMGIDELSVSPVFTLALRKKIRETE